MGFYDGVNGTDRASAWQVARAANLPVVLAIRPGGSSLTLAAQVRGLLTFRADSQIRGLVLTACRPSLYAHLAPILEEETDCRFWVTSLPWRRQTLAAVILAC